jgi:hypothetical protein
VTATWFSLSNGSFVIEEAAKMQPPRPPGAEIAVSTRKEMQIILLSIAGAYFSESGLFNGLRPIQIRKKSLLSASLGSREFDPANGKGIPRILIFVKELFAPG